MMEGLKSENACREFLKSQSPSLIAQQLLQDKAACQNSRLPSILVHYLPSANTDLANEIALELFPETASYPRAIRRAQYNGLTTILKSSLQHMQSPSRHGSIPSVNGSSNFLTTQDFRTALEVLDFCLKSDEQLITMRSSVEDAIRVFKPRASDDFKTTNERAPSNTPKVASSRQKTCYICQYALLTSHRQYPSLCQPCGAYNLSSSALSLPDNLHLKGQTALVTGGRIHLGFHTALRLLRCGAKVIVTTRYPRDAEARFAVENDSNTWNDRIRIIGADFRAASDVFQLVNHVKHILQDWSRDGEIKLDILINNAAQTLTDSVEKEHEAVLRESKLKLEYPFKDSRMLLEGDSYNPRIRGGALQSKTLKSSSTQFLEQDAPAENNSNNISLAADSKTASQITLQPFGKPSKSSWLQSIHQIPYEDVISAHSVNTFVPLILIRELLPFMGLSPSQDIGTQKSVKAAAYIINVTSREGIFEASNKSSAKNGKHVHTNLTKAALNMLTETEAAPAWKERRVAMNSVDPGFMSAAPEVEKGWKEREGENWQCPIGWEDGAGRVLWPIAVAENDQGVVWGRFLKHYGSVEVDVGVGR